MSGIKETRVVKFIRKGDKGSDAVRYWLIPSVSTVVLTNIEGGDGTPAPKTVSCRLVKQVGDDSPTTISNPSGAGLTMSYSTVRSGVTSARTAYTSGNVNVPTNIAYTAIEFSLYKGGTLIDVATIAILRDGTDGQPGLQGLQGPQGEQGIQGPKGDNGLPSYFHIKYSTKSNPTAASDMTENPSEFIGTYVDNTAADSNDPKKYTWARFQGIQGPKGEQGIPGVGADGRTSYLHIKYSDDGGKTFTPASDGYAIGETPGEYIGQYTDFIMLDSVNVNSYTWSKIKGEQGEPGTPGKDGVIYDVELSPAAIYVAPDSSTKIAQITATAYKTIGTNRVAATNGSMYLLYTKADNTTNRIPSTGLMTNGALIYNSVVFEYEVNGQVVAKAALQINREGQPGTPGSKGDRGPALRGPQAWSDCANNYSFQTGSDGEEWKDVVIYGNKYYSCIKSHAKTTSNYPGSTADQNNQYWRLAQSIELVATKILLATYALVKNLGVECIDMKDVKGNVLFQAKDGNVTCKTGTFTNIKVTGDITAEYLNLKTSSANHNGDTPALANGAICNSASAIILPELPQGTARSMRILNPVLSRTAPSDLVLRPASTNVLISKDLSWLHASNTDVTLSDKGYNAGFYVELIGVREIGKTQTYWLMSEMTPGLIS